MSPPCRLLKQLRRWNGEIYSVVLSCHELSRTAEGQPRGAPEEAAGAAQAERNVLPRIALRVAESGGESRLVRNEPSMSLMKTERKPKSSPRDDEIEHTLPQAAGAGRAVLEKGREWTSPCPTLEKE